VEGVDAESFPFGLWNGGFGFHFAADAIDAFVIPLGAGNTRNQVRFMRDFGTTVLCATASYPLRIAEVAEEMGIDLRELPVSKEAMPLIRYRSGEVSAVLSREPCECGIEHMTIKRIKGRTDDMVIYKGVKFYPADVEAILASHGIRHYQIEVGNGIVVKFEGDESLIGQILKDIKEFLGFKPKLVALSPGSLERSKGKAKRLVRVGDAS